MKIKLINLRLILITGKLVGLVHVHLFQRTVTEKEKEKYITYCLLFVLFQRLLN